MQIDAGGATALIASVAKPLPRWAGFILVPCVTISSVSSSHLAEVSSDRHLAYVGMSRPGTTLATFVQLVAS